MEGEFQKEHVEHLNADIDFFQQKQIKIHDPFKIPSKVIEELCREISEKQLPSLPLHLLPSLCSGCLV